MGADFRIDHTLRSQIYRSWDDTGRYIICEFLGFFDRIIAGDNRSTIWDHSIDGRCGDELTSDEYCNRLSDKTFCEFSEYFCTLSIEVELDFRSTYLRKCDGRTVEVSIIEDFSIFGLRWHPFARLFRYEYIRIGIDPFILS